MSVPRGEGSVAGPEAGALINYGEELRKQHIVGGEVVEQYRPQVWAMANRVVSSLVDPGQQEAVRLYAGIVDWQLFGKPGDALPDGLRLFRVQESVAIEPNTAIPYVTRRMPEHVDAQLGRLGMADIGNRLQQEVNKNGMEIEATLGDFLRQSAEYQLLASFDRPEQHPQDQPLNRYWQNVRRAQIEHDVQNQYGLDRLTGFVPGSPARHELNRRLYHVDDETRQQLGAPKGGIIGLARARTYLTPYVSDALNADMPEHERRTLRGIYFQHEHRGSMVVDYQEADGSNELDDLESVAELAGELLSKKIYTGQEDMRHISGLFAGLAIEQIFHARTRNIGEALEEAVKIAIEITRDTVRTMLHDVYSAGYPGDTELLLKAPQAPVTDDRAAPKDRGYDGAWDGVFRRAAQLSTRSEVLANRYAAEGVVVKYGPDNFRVAARMILQTLSAVPMGAADTAEDLVIELSNYDGRTNLHIPGYTAVSKNGEGRFGFAVDGNGDQYVSCEVPVNEQQRSKLADEYRALGLEALADKLKAQTHMTVNDLSGYIREATVYHLPEILDTEDPESQRETFIDSLADFEPLVRGGKLYAQCTGSALFIKHSLDAIFGYGSTSVLAGMTLNGGRRYITAAWHAQAAFSDGETQYILDATPHAALDDPMDELLGSSGVSAGERHAATAPRAAWQPKDSAKEVRTEQEVKSTEVRIDELTVSFTEQAKVALGQPNDQKLFKYLSKLPRHDPARRTYEILRQFRIGRIDAELVNEGCRYIAQCRDASPKIRQKLGMGHYSPAFLEQLHTTALYLQFIVEGR